MEGMVSGDLRMRTSQRDRGLDMVRDWTWTAGIGGVVLTVLFAAVAANSFAGHNTTASSNGTSSGSATQFQPSGDDGGFQAAPPTSFGNSNQAPAVVSGGS